MGVIYKNQTVSTLPPLTRSPSPNRGGLRADNIRPYGSGANFPTSRRISSSVFALRQSHLPQRGRLSAGSRPRPTVRDARLSGGYYPPLRSGVIQHGECHIFGGVKVPPYRIGCAARRADNFRSCGARIGANILISACKTAFAVIK